MAMSKFGFVPRVLTGGVSHSGVDLAAKKSSEHVANLGKAKEAVSTLLSTVSFMASRAGDKTKYQEVESIGSELVKALDLVSKPMATATSKADRVEALDLAEHKAPTLRMNS